MPERFELQIKISTPGELAIGVDWLYWRQYIFKSLHQGFWGPKTLEDSIMAYGLDLVEMLCGEFALRSLTRTETSLEAELEPGVVLCFVNAEDDEMMGFKGTPWHVHGSIGFSDTHAGMELRYDAALHGLAEGSVLICELWRGDQLIDRWLVHAEFNDEFKYLQCGEEIRVKRIHLRA